jgi:glyoxylase-like metal-dependent hydrolase (beta-lactamase superfamily II)
MDDSEALMDGVDEDGNADVDVGSLSPETLAARLRADESVSVLDVRNRDEAEAWPLPGETVTTVQIPYYRFVQAGVNDTVDELAAEVRESLTAPVVVVCGRGEASDTVAAQLREVGVDAVNLAGGMQAWARVCHTVDIETDAADRVVQFQRPASGCLSYLVVADGEALVVDPLRAFTDHYLDGARRHGAEIVAAVDTHVHADHVSGVRALADATDAGVFLPDGSRDRGLAFDARLLAGGDTLSVGEATLDAVALPGHTSEMLGLRLGDLLFAGDTVFLDSVARPDLEAGDAGAPAAAERLHDTLSTIPDDVRIAPAHWSPTSRPDDDGAYVGWMAAIRDRLDIAPDRETFVDRLLDRMGPRPANYERIIDVNLGVEHVDDDEAFEMELGPNNCAATPTAEAD